MLPTTIVTDPSLKENGIPIKGAMIFNSHIRVHPDNLEKVLDGLKLMTEGSVEFNVISVQEFKETSRELN